MTVPRTCVPGASRSVLLGVTITRLPKIIALKFVPVGSDGDAVTPLTVTLKPTRDVPKTSVITPLDATVAAGAESEHVVVGVMNCVVLESGKNGQILRSEQVAR
jgi:hypothetical protein